MYAKFDRLAAELSDDEDARPTVTRLAAPSRVTIGPAGASVAQPPAPPPVVAPPGYHWEPRPDPPIGPQLKPGGTELDYSKWDKWAEAQSSDDDAYVYDDDEDDDAVAGHAPGAPASGGEAPVAPEAAAAAAGGASGRARATRAAEFSRNGGAVEGHYLWSQSEAEVTVSALVPPGTRARDVSVRLAPPAHTDGAPHGPAEPPVLRVALAGEAEPLLHAALAHAVDTGANAGDADCECDWELTDFDAESEGAPPRRAVRVTLRKASPGGAVVHWWARALAGGPAIDTSAIADRGRTAARTAAARDAWAEAEALFKSRAAQRVPVEVDVSGGE